MHSNHLCYHSPDFQLILEGRINFCAVSQPATCAATCVTTYVFSGVQFALAQRQKLSFTQNTVLA